MRKPWVWQGITKQSGKTCHTCGLLIEAGQPVVVVQQAATRDQDQAQYVYHPQCHHE